MPDAKRTKKKAARKLGVGVIGAGGIARQQHLPGYAARPDLCDIVAVCDVVEDAARAAAEQFNVPHVYTDFKQLVARDDIDLVSVCTPNLYHHKPAIAALKAGKHVLCEKPLADTVEHAEAMVAAARKAKRQLMCGYHTRFDPGVEALKTFVDEGRLGQVYWARSQALRRRGVPAWGVFIEKDKQGGGPLIDIGVHILDATLYLMGHPKPVAASGAIYTMFGHRDDVYNPWGQWDPAKFTVEDFATAMVRFEDGATLMLETSFVANLPADAFCATILGDQGGLTTHPPRFYTESQQQVVEITPTMLPSGRPHHKEVEHFLLAVRDGFDVRTPGEQALMVARIVDGIYRSAEAGKEVEI